MFWSAGSNGNSPVWVTVLVARFIGGFAGGYFGLMLMRTTTTGTLITSAGGGDSPKPTLLLTFGPGIAGALITGVAISMLSPGMSGRTVGLGNAVLAAVAGAMLPLIATLVVAHGLINSDSATSVMVIAGASPFISLLAMVGSVAITAWMVDTSSAGGERWRGGRVPANQSWSDIESMDTHGAEYDERQAERGYWGGLYGSEEDPKP